MRKSFESKRIDNFEEDDIDKVEYKVNHSSFSVTNREESDIISC